jgi:hypothetical protein
MPWATLRNDLEDSQKRYVHSDRLRQIDHRCEKSSLSEALQEDNTNVDISDLDLNATKHSQCSEVIESTKTFLKKSSKERRDFNKQKKLDQLSKRRSGRVLTKRLSQGQRKYLQCIPKDTIREYLEDRN